MRFSMLTYRTILFLLAFLCATPMAGAEVPREILERLVEIRVETSKLRHLNNIGKITDGEHYRLSGALQTEATGLWEPYKRSLQPEALSTVEGLTRAKLGLLAPQWQKEAEGAQQAKEAQQKQTALDLEQDARRALEFQRQRLVLQKQLNSGATDQDSYAQKDRAALAGITDLRKKYESFGGSWPQQFDNRLALLTKALANNPATVLPHSQVQAETGEGRSAGGGHAKPDFNHDVQLAAEILFKMEENSARFQRKQITSDTFRETAVVYVRDFSRLRLRYQAVSIQRLQEFESAYTKMAAPAIQALKVKYYPGKYLPPPPKTPAGNPYYVPETPQYGAWIFWGVLIFGGLGLLVWLSMSKEEPVPPPPFVPPLTDIHGSANWAAHETNPSSSTNIAGGVMFGQSSRPELHPDALGAPITSQPQSHTLIVARTRAGKGTRVIVPTLLRYKHSMLIIDPKGENAAITARTRRDQLRHTVHIVNPWGEMEDRYKKLGFSSATFNPLDAIDRHDPNAVAIAQSLAAIICPVTDGKDQYWQGSAANVLTGVLLWLTDQDGLPRGHASSQTETKTLARAREIVTQSREDFKKDLAKMIVSTGFQGAIKEMVGQYMDLAPETYSGIMSNLAESTKFLSDPRIKASTQASSFSMQRLRDELITVYLVIPHDRIQTHSTWLRLVIASAMQALKTRNRLPTPPRHRCMFLIDEFGSIGHIADIPRDIALMAGYGLDFTLIVQGLDQLKHHYGEAKDTILSNCGYKWFCNVNELETAKYLSESLGKKTVRTKGTSQSSSSSSSSTASDHPTSTASSTSGDSTTYGETGRSLLTPDEILTLGRDTAILLNPLDNPHYLRPVDYWDLTKTFAYLRERHPQFYWNPPLRYDPNPYYHDPNRGESKEEARNGAQQSSEAMTDKKARQILEVGDKATRKEILAAHSRLIRKFHPDVGGSNYFASQLNAAKDFLLGKP